MIKNIILDMGNVLLDFRPEVSVKHFFEDEEDRKLIMKELFNGPEWIMADRGLITNSRRFDGVSKRVPERLHEKLKACVEGWDMCMCIHNGSVEYSKQVHVGAPEFCELMKQKGYRLFVLSNACDRFHHYFPRYFDLSLFEGIIVSSDVKMLKPDREIYLYLLEKYKLVPEECLFIDDREENVLGAKECGLQGVVFDGEYESVVEQFEL